MKRDDIIRMAREAGFHPIVGGIVEGNLFRFAKAIEQHLSYDGIHTCHDECQRPACVAIREAVKAEREKSLQLWMLLDDVDTADDIAKADDAVYRSLCRQANIKRWSVLNGDEVDAVIRARSEK